MAMFGVKSNVTQINGLVYGSIRSYNHVIYIDQGKALQPPLPAESGLVLDRAGDEVSQGQQTRRGTQRVAIATDTLPPLEHLPDCHGNQVQLMMVLCHAALGIPDHTFNILPYLTVTDP